MKHGLVCFGAVCRRLIIILQQFFVLELVFFVSGLKITQISIVCIKNNRNKSGELPGGYSREFWIAVCREGS